MNKKLTEEQERDFKKVCQAFAKQITRKHIPVIKHEEMYQPKPFKKEQKHIGFGLVNGQAVPLYLTELGDEIMRGRK